MQNNQYTVTGLTCGGCVKKVTAILQAHADHVSVSLEPPMASLRNVHSSLNAINQALGDRYTLTPIPNALDVNTLSVNTSEANASAIKKPPADKSWLSTYYPLLLIIGFIVLVCTCIQLSQPTAFDWSTWMRHFMAGFFLVFAFFKLLDIKSFASSYAMYDLLAMRINNYGLIYPFIELGLGIAYLINWQPTIVNAVTFVVMLFSSLGVIQSVINQQKIRCACLGSVFNLPMSTVTIIEDLSMAGMALIILLY